MTTETDTRSIRRRLFVAGALLAAALLAAAVDLFLLSATPGFDGVRVVNIRPGVELRQVADSLAGAGILERTTGFRWLARLTGWGDQIKAGHYEFESGVSNRDVLDVLRKGLQTPVRLRIPSGARRERIVQALAGPMAYSEDDVREALADSAFSASLATDTTHLWAYMLPETYFFYWLTPERDVIRRIKETTSSRISASIDSSRGVPLNMTEDEIIRLAGIVEWETAHVPEKKTVAGVYINRLRDHWALQADPTIQYALIQLEGSKRRLLFRDYEIDHPYNTYRYRGLPPGPITNPSESSIEAVINPESHRYYYFVARGDGRHIFSRTLAEHRRNANEYYRVMRERRAAQADEAAGS
jgi:UPF0755 protein